MATIADSGIRIDYFPVLVEAALDRIALARCKMTDGRPRESSRLLAAAVTLVSRLRDDLDFSGGDSYAANLDDVCDYVSRQLVTAQAQSRVATLDEMSYLLREIRTAWVVYV